MAIMPLESKTPVFFYLKNPNFNILISKHNVFFHLGVATRRTGSNIKKLSTLLCSHWLDTNLEYS
jgi:hypothetical protein